MSLFVQLRLLGLALGALCLCGCASPTKAERAAVVAAQSDLGRPASTTSSFSSSSANDVDEAGGPLAHPAVRRALQLANVPLFNQTSADSQKNQSLIIVILCFVGFVLCVISFVIYLILINRPEKRLGALFRNRRDERQW